MAKGRKCRPPGYGGWVKLDDERVGYVDAMGVWRGRDPFPGNNYATGWRLLKDLPPRSELVRELAEARLTIISYEKLELDLRAKLANAEASLDGWRKAEQDGHAARESLRADLEHRTNSLTEALADLADTKAKLEAAERDRLAQVAEYETRLLDLRKKLEAAETGRPRFNVGERVVIGWDKSPGVVTAIVPNWWYGAQKDEGKWTGQLPERELSAAPAPTAQPEPAWVDCSAQSAREMHARRHRVRNADMATGGAFLQDGSLPRGVAYSLVGCLRNLATSTDDRAGWQWQEVAS